MNEDVVRQVTSLNGVNVIDIACGESHTCALTSDGDVYTWGSGQIGQLGHGDFHRQSLPIKVANINEKIVQVACGKKHTVALTSDGKVYSWGSNESGQLGRTITVQNLKLNVKRSMINTSGGQGLSNNYNFVGSAKTSPHTNLLNH
jgi:alpha-tubulin suppressor-like RCC1 family protein